MPKTSGRARAISLFLLLATIGGLSSCCEPAHKNSQPAIVDSLFTESYGFDLDLFRTRVNGTGADSGYYPIYSFGVKNTGTDDDVFTMKIVYNSSLITGAEIDISKTVKAGETDTFFTPRIPMDPNATYIFPNFVNPADTSLPLYSDYFGFFQTSPDSTEIHYLRPNITIYYGAIDNGPEACNTPASAYTVNIDRLPRK